MQQLTLALLLDEDGRGLVGVLGGVLLALVLSVALIVSTPLALLGAAFAGPAAPPRVTQTHRQAEADLPAPAGSGPVEVARRYLGVPYLFGGTDPRKGLDCSALVQLVFRQLGVPLPRTAQLQYLATRRVPRDQLQPGDLVFFARTYTDPHDWITHVGIYVGGGLQINAPTTDQVVSIQPVFAGFWGTHYAGAGRVERG